MNENEHVFFSPLSLVLFQLLICTLIGFYILFKFHFETSSKDGRMEKILKEIEHQSINAKI